jgi:hypothetical protein
MSLADHALHAAPSRCIVSCSDKSFQIDKKADFHARGTYAGASRSGLSVAPTYIARCQGDYALEYGWRRDERSPLRDRTGRIGATSRNKPTTMAPNSRNALLLARTLTHTSTRMCVTAFIIPSTSCSACGSRIGDQRWTRRTSRNCAVANKKRSSMSPSHARYQADTRSCARAHIHACNGIVMLSGYLRANRDLQVGYIISIAR